MRGRKRSNFGGVAARLIALSILFAPLGVSRGAEPVAGEYDLKAAFVYQFTHFTEWPADAFDDDESPIVVAVVGEDPFHGSLERAVRDKTVHGRRLAYRHFPNANAMEPCHVLYVSATERHRLGQIRDDARDFGALTIADMDGFTRAGGMIRFVTEHKKVRFEIRREAAEEAGLRLKAQLLKVAKVYRE